VQGRFPKILTFLGPLLLSLTFACGDEKTADTLFSQISSRRSGIRFSNDLTFSQEFNIYTYRNFYNGGGVALGDVNNDGLIDVYFTGNQVDNRLYLNRGDFRFEDATESAGVAGTKAWSTGVSMADVNGDGWLDIYVCNSGDVEGDNKENELFINNSDGTFTERAHEYGVADPGFTTHAAFFDYDKDGDLDLYVLNNSYQAIGSFNLRKNERPRRDARGGDKLLRNDNGHFVDVSEEAGVYGSLIGFGLGVTIGDVDKDGWQDIYVSNDFFERDYLYINNTNGTFREVLTEQMKSICGASMGADLADINNDTWPDLFVTDMLPGDHGRLKTVTTFENWDRYAFNLETDYYHQFTRNTLQLNNGNSTYSEIGRLAGVEATDWSWGALMFDMDNDGLRDIFVANGIYQDLTNQDYLQYISNEEVVKSIVGGGTVNYKKLVELIPSHAVANCAFRNLGNLAFTDEAASWGLGTPGFSNGSAYGDLDNDGDLDLVVNNVNSEAWVYRNNTETHFPDRRYLRFELKGAGLNTYALGTKITVHAGDTTWYAEQMPIRGFESSVDPRITLGLGANKVVDEVVVEWPGGGIQRLTHLTTNQVLRLSESEVEVVQKLAEHTPPGTRDMLALPVKSGVPEFAHQENSFSDFDRDYLTFHMLSTEGPRMAAGDVNRDGLTDVFIGGAKDQAGALFLQQRSGSFIRASVSAFEADRGSEDTDSEWFDADADGDLDLYVCSGGNEFSTSSSDLLDRLYLNDGRGGLSRSRQPLPTSRFESSSCVASADYDMDGDLDLFIGIRTEPFRYGVPVNGYLLRNDGKGAFSDATALDAPALGSLGMITDAVWSDLDSDADPDLVIVGEYMPVLVFLNTHGKLAKMEVAGLAGSNGWWNRIEAADIDSDGDTDFVAGNHGWNSRFKAADSRPVRMYVNDFDRNGSIEQVVTRYFDTVAYPMVLRHDLVRQMPSLKKKYLKYEEYKDQRVEDIFPAEELSSAIVLEAHQTSTCLLINDGKGNLSLRALPVEAQLSPVYGIEIFDFDGDSHTDLLLGGNLYRAKPEVGRYDASYGTLLKGDGTGGFTALHPDATGFQVDGEVRDIITINSSQGVRVLVARNNASVLGFELNRRK
jgi:hypothetical protein